MANTLIGKIAAASIAVGALKADKTNAAQNYMYISADKILEKAGAALANAGIAIIPFIEHEETVQVNYTDNYGKSKTRFDAMVRFIMMVADGETQMDISWRGRGTDFLSSDKALYKAITSGHKYFLMKLLNIGVGNEDGEHENEASVAQDATRNNSSATKPALREAQGGPQKAQSGTSAPKRQVDASTGEITDNDAPTANPFDDATPYYVHAWNQLTGKPYDLVKWIAALHKGSAGECTKKQYQYLTGLVDALTGNEHNYALSVLCQSEISKVNMVGAKVAATLLEIIPATITKMEAAASTHEVPNPKHRVDMVEMIKTIAAAQVLDGPLPLTDQAEDMRMAAA